MVNDYIQKQVHITKRHSYKFLGEEKKERYRKRRGKKKRKILQCNDVLYMLKNQSEIF